MGEISIIKLSRLNNASAAISYAQGKGKFQDKDRTWLQENGVAPDVVNKLSDRAVASGGELVDLMHVKSDMKATRDLFGNRGTTQAIGVIHSFSDKEFSALEPKDWQTVNELGMELGRRMAPNHELVVYTHLDGDGHKLHNHIIINSPELTTGRKYHHNNDAVRVMKINNEISKEYGLMTNDLNSKHKENRTFAERSISKRGGYVWKDDLRNRIDQAILESRTSDFGAFSATLQRSGVIILNRSQKLTFFFVNKKGNLCKVSSEKLGEKYQQAMILKMIANNK